MRATNAQATLGSAGNTPPSLHGLRHDNPTLVSEDNHGVVGVVCVHRYLSNDRSGNEGSGHFQIERLRASGLDYAGHVVHDGTCTGTLRPLDRDRVVCQISEGILQG